MSAYNSAMNTEIPVVYTAISDPVAAQLADDDGNSVGNITGTIRCTSGQGTVRDDPRTDA